ncbi:MG2 domain-containing protein [Pigmentibacter sp. JX0631]|uniref:MG2 domain-containing protein n=1 Tax=Pigmentibacter sp. JX0631 TaxID=2976982 RepID=UPI002468F9E2|nr:MG2 domain-containing protein [Pigmentibacter sp. JX0631]WGL61145.1 MG2 domain-containing protein [Pigmentibacter sp. JX0631]
MYLIRNIFYIFILLNFLSVSASPFYLTIENSFSSEENAKIRLDYQNRDIEMELRILQPINIDKFLEGQLNISRTYEEPTTKLNAGHFIAKGLNRVDVPLDKLRRFISPEFRKNFTDILSDSIKILPKVSVADQRKSIFILPPSNTKLVKKFRIPLMGNTEIIEGETPGFEFSEISENKSYNQNNIILPKLPSGLYLIQVVQGQDEAQSILQISDISMQVKQSTNQVLITAMNRDMSPVEGATVYLRDSRGKWLTSPSKTNSAGQLLVEDTTPFDSKLVVRLEKNGINAFASTEFLSVNEAKSDIFLMTDRPIFKPGEEVYFKGIMRSRDSGKLITPISFFNTPIKRLDKIDIVDNKGALVQSLKDINLTKFGSFSGKIALQSDQTPGIYQIHAQSEQNSYSGEFRVRDYVKPTFYLQLEKMDGSFYPGKTVNLKFKAIRYSGGVPSDAKYEIYVYRKKFEVAQWISEEGYGIQSGSDYFGKKLTNSQNQPIRIFSSVDVRLQGVHGMQEESSSSEKKSEDKAKQFTLKNSNNGVFEGSWSSANEFDSSGMGEFEFTLPESKDSEDEEWTYSLMIKAMDAQGSQAILTENYPVTLSEAYPSLSIKNIISNTKSNNEIFIHSSMPNGDIAKNASGIVTFKLLTADGKEKKLDEIPFTTNEDGVTKIMTPKIESTGKIIAKAKLISLNKKKMKNSSESDSVEFIVADETNSAVLDNSQVELFSNIKNAEVNSKFKLLALLPKGWGNNEKGIAWITIAGSKIYEKKLINLTGRSAWLDIEAKESYGNGFFVTLTIPKNEGRFLERSISFKILQKDKKLNISVLNNKKVLEPMEKAKIKFHVTKYDKSPAANVELAVSIVDKAVYDVQNEFRPSIIDFFYPDPKLNLMTFYSDDLQGYGFADKIRRENFDLFALKAKNQLARNKMRDTATWVPHVVTDQSGNAEIVVNMPANVTEWVINVVAIDQDGRFGEQKSYLKTVTDLSTNPNISQFLRTDDELNFNVRFYNSSNLSPSFTSKIIASDNLFLKNSIVNGQILAMKDIITPFSVKALTPSGLGNLTFSFHAAGLKTGGESDYSLKLIPNGIQQNFPGTFNSNNLTFNIPEKAKISDLHVQATYGLTGYILLASNWLITYPYGCTEQLVSSTLPNLVLYKLFNELGVKDDKLGQYKQVYDKALSNSELGLKKLIENQLSNGAFTMWKQNPSPSVYMTLIAAYGLEQANFLAMKGEVSEALDHAKDWLSMQNIEKLLIKDDQVSEDNFLFFRNAAILNVIPSEKLEKVFKNIIDSPLDKISISSLVYTLEILESWTYNDSISKIKKENYDILLQKLQDKILEDIPKINNQVYFKNVKLSDSEENLPFPIDYITIYSSAYNILFKNNKINKEFENLFKNRLIETLNENGYSFGSTFNTAQVIINLKDVVKNEVKMFKKLSTSSINIKGTDNETILKLTPTLGGFSGNLKNLKSDKSINTLVPENLPNGFSLLASAKAFVPMNDIKEMDNGIKIKKEFLKYNEKKKEVQKINLSELKIGDIVLVKLTIKRSKLNNNRNIHSNFLVVEDLIPSIAEGVDNDDIYLSDFKIKTDAILETKRYPEKIVRVLELPSNENDSLEIYNVWNVRFSGMSSIPATKATDMYNDNIFGLSSSFEVKNN